MGVRGPVAHGCLRVGRRRLGSNPEPFHLGVHTAINPPSAAPLRPGYCTPPPCSIYGLPLPVSLSPSLSRVLVGGSVGAPVGSLSLSLAVFHLITRPPQHPPLAGQRSITPGPQMMASEGRCGPCSRSSCCVFQPRRFIPKCNRNLR